MWGPLASGFAAGLLQVFCVSVSVCDFESFRGFAHSASLLTSRARGGSWGPSPGVRLLGRGLSLPPLLSWVSLAGGRSALQIFSEGFPAFSGSHSLTLTPSGSPGFRRMFSSQLMTAGPWLCLSETRKHFVLGVSF